MLNKGPLMVPQLVIANQFSSCSIMLLFHSYRKFKANFFVTQLLSSPFSQKSSAIIRAEPLK